MATKTAYTIQLVDQASASAARVRDAMGQVATAAQRVANAVRTEDRAYQAVARTAAKFAGAELRAARALSAVDREALRASKAVDRLNNIQRKALPVQRRANESWLAGARGLVAGGVAAAFLVKQVFDAGRGLLEAAGRAEAFDRSLDALGRGAGGEALSENWTKELIRLRVPLEQGRADVQKLLASFRDVANLNAGVAVNDILKLGAALQLSADQSKSFNKVFSDTAGKGKIQREELTTQLAEIGIGVTIPGFLTQVSKSIGKSYAEVEKMLSDGKITADIAIPALITATLDARNIENLDSEAEKAAKGATGTLTNLDNAWDRLKTKLGESLIQKGALEQIDKLSESLNRLADNADKVVANLDRLAAVWKVLGGDTSVSSTDIIPGVEKGSTAQKILDFTPNDAIDKIGSFWKNFFTAGKNLGDATSAGMAAGLTGGAGQAADAATGLAESVTAASKTELEIKSPSKVFAEQGRYIDEGLATGIEDHQDLAFASAEALADGVSAEAEMATMIGSGVNQTAVANVGAAAGNALGGSSGAAAGGMVGPVTINIQVDGAAGADSVVEAIRSWFDTDFAALLERQLEGSGA